MMADHVFGGYGGPRGEPLYWQSPAGGTSTAHDPIKGSSNGTQRCAVVNDDEDARSPLSTALISRCTSNYCQNATERRNAVKASYQRLQCGRLARLATSLAEATKGSAAPVVAWRPLEGAALAQHDDPLGALQRGEVPALILRGLVPPAELRGLLRRTARFARRRHASAARSDAARSKVSCEMARLLTAFAREAAALPTAHLTSFQALFVHGALPKRDARGASVLVLGASGGCGLSALAIARAAGADEIVAVCSAAVPSAAVALSAASPSAAVDSSSAALAPSAAVASSSAGSGDGVSCAARRTPRRRVTSQYPRRRKCSG